jgi:hypothetical protein
MGAAMRSQSPDSPMKCSSSDMAKAARKREAQARGVTA